MKNISSDVALIGFIVLAATFTLGHYWGTMS